MDKHDTPAGDTPALAVGDEVRILSPARYSDGSIFEDDHQVGQVYEVKRYCPDDANRPYLVGDFWYDADQLELAPAATRYPWADNCDLTGGLIESDLGSTLIAAPEHSGGFDLRHVRPAVPPGGWQAGMRARVVSVAGYMAAGYRCPLPVGHEGVIGAFSDDGTVNVGSGFSHPADLLYLPPAAPAVADWPPVDSWWRHIPSGDVVQYVGENGLFGSVVRNTKQYGHTGGWPQDYEPYTPRPGEWLTNGRDCWEVCGFSDCGKHVYTRHMADPNLATSIDISQIPGEFYPCPPPDTAPAKPATESVPPVDLDVAWQHLCYPPRGFTPPADIAKMQREIAALFAAAAKFALKPRGLGQTEARKLASLFAELKESTTKPPKPKRGNPIRETIDAYTGPYKFSISRATMNEWADLLDAALAKRGKWRKRAERWKERCKGVGSELSKAHDWIDSLEAKLIVAEQQRDAARAEADTLRRQLADAERDKALLKQGWIVPDPPPAAPATDPAGEPLPITREVTVLVDGRELLRCTCSSYSILAPAPGWQQEVE